MQWRRAGSRRRSHNSIGPIGHTLARGRRRPTTTTVIPAATGSTSQAQKKQVPLPAPTTLIPLTSPAPVGEGAWTAEGRPVSDVPAVDETALVPPGGTQAAGIAWMDTRLLSAQLYSGSKSPGGGPYEFTAPVQPAQAATLVAAFNGGFMMNAAQGGYYTEGRTVVPLVAGAASLVIYANGSVDRRRMGHRCVHDTRRGRRPAEPRSARRGRATDRPSDQPRLAGLGGHVWCDLVLLHDPGDREPVAIGCRCHLRRRTRVHGRTRSHAIASSPSSSCGRGSSEAWSST